jgi:hypothetical protein
LKLQAASLSAASAEMDVELAKPTPRSDVLGITARVIISPQDLNHGAEDELSWPRGERSEPKRQDVYWQSCLFLD